MGYVDLDLFANINSGNYLIEYNDGDALKSALQLYISLNAGDLIGFPAFGGVLDSLPFKNFNGPEVNGLYFKLFNDITKQFTPEIIIKDIQIIPDNITHILEVNLFYTNPITGESDKVTNFFKLKSNEIISKTWTDITLTGENLYLFCVSQKDTYPNEKLLFDNELGGIFVWANFKFLNLTRNDTYFDAILLLLNTSI